MRSKQRMKHFKQPFLPTDFVRLGRFTVNVREPHQTYRDPFPDKAPQVLKTDKAQLAQLYSSETRSEVGIEGTVVAYGARLKDTSDFHSISTEKSTIYQLDNSEDWFYDAVRQPETRDWILKAVSAHGKIYIIVGYQTVCDAQLDEAATRSNGFSAGIQLPASTAIAASGVPLPIGDLIDPGVSRDKKTGNIVQATFTAPGEQVLGIQYRRIRFKWYSSRDMDSATLETETRWKFNWDYRGRAEGVNDVCGVELATDDGESDSSENHWSDADGDD